MIDQQSTNNFLRRAFLKRPDVTGFVVTLASFLMTGGGRAALKHVVPKGPHSEAYIAGIQQSILAIVVVVVLWKMGWLRAARVSSRPRPARNWWSYALIPTALIPFISFGDIDWGRTAAIFASAFDYGTTGVVEELVFRGLVMTGLSVGLGGKSKASLKVIVASSIFFGLVHLSPVGIVFATVFGLGFAHLTISTNTIWWSVLVHFGYDFLTDLPRATTGTENRWFVMVPILLLIVSSGVVAVVSARMEKKDLFDDDLDETDEPSRQASGVNRPPSAHTSVIEDVEVS